MHGINRSVTPGLPSGYKRNLRKESDDLSDKDVDIQDKSEETKEIAAYLSLIRKRHDRIKQENLKKKMHLEKLKKTYEVSLELAQNSEENNISVEQKIENVKTSLESTREEYKKEMKDYKSYEHILDRMKKDKIAMEIKANSIQISLKSTKQVLNSEIKRFQHIKENQYQSRMILQDMRTTFSLSRRKKTEYISNLERELKSREEIAERREDRQKRQFEIAEAAANDDKDSHEVKLREALLLYKVWFSYINKKLTCEMQQAVDVERAFSKIKSATGLSDVNEIVEKFLTRERNYFILINAVNEAEKKLNYLRTENLTAKEMLHNLHYNDPKIKNDETSKGTIIANEKKMTLGYKVYADLKEKVKNSLRIYDQLLNWTEKILLVLHVQNTEEIKANNVIQAKRNLLNVFNDIYNALEKLVGTIQYQTEDTKNALKTYNQMKTSEIVEKMSTEEALSKIVRIRIESFCSNADDNESVFDIKDAKINKAKNNKNSM